MFKKEIYVERRKKLREKFESGVILIPSNKDSPIGFEHNCYPFIQDSVFNYYFGIKHPDLIAAIDIDSGKDYIFGKEFQIDDIIWMGKLKFLHELSTEVGVDLFKEKEDLLEYIKIKKEEKSQIHFTEQYKSDNILELSKIIGIDPYKFSEYTSEKLTKAIVNQRNYKSPEEIASIEDAVAITKEMHLAGIRNVKEGMYEYQVVAEIEANTKRYNATTSFQTIFSKHGEVLHNHSHNNIIKNGDLMLLDCGAKNEEGYCGDMTTTFPVSGKFSDEQRDIYELVLEMFNEGKNKAKPGVSYMDVHLDVCRVLARGMVKRGIMKGDIEDIVKNGAHAIFMPHGLGHMLGLDVHDMENLGELLVGYDSKPKSTQFGLKSLRLGRELEENFVFTIEPGIYFIPELIEKWENEGKFKEFIVYDELNKFKNFGGIRFERDFVVTKDSCRQLGPEMPNNLDEIEDLMK